MIIHQLKETKQSGMTITKSMVMQFDGAPESARITVDAGTWQIDLTDKIKEIVREMFNARDDERYPVGYMLFTENSNNPETYGYRGKWRLEESDLALISCTDEMYVGKITGENNTLVPIPEHNHSATFIGDALPGHAHEYNEASLQVYSPGHGSVYGNNARISQKTKETNQVSSGTPAGNITINSTGTKNARIDVRGKHKLVFIWKRVA